MGRKIHSRLIRGEQRYPKQLHPLQLSLGKFGSNCKVQAQLGAAWQIPMQWTWHRSTLTQGHHPDALHWYKGYYDIYIELFSQHFRWDMVWIFDHIFLMTFSSCTFLTGWHASSSQLPIIIRTALHACASEQCPSLVCTSLTLIAQPAGVAGKATTPTLIAAWNPQIGSYPTLQFCVQRVVSPCCCESHSHPYLMLSTPNFCSKPNWCWASYSSILAHTTH